MSKERDLVSREREVERLVKKLERKVWVFKRRTISLLDRCLLVVKFSLKISMDDGLLFGFKLYLRRIRWKLWILGKITIGGSWSSFVFFTKSLE